MPTYLNNANDILIDLDGDRAYLEDNALWTHDILSAGNPDAAIEFNKTDLGEPSIDKLINYFDIDYTGAFTLYLYYDNASLAWSSTMVDHSTSRSTEWICLPLVNRRAFQKMFLVIVANDANAKIYSIEIDFQVLKRRRLE